MARPLWKGSISFGLVNIPVELFVGARDHTPRFRLLHRTDLSPIGLERVCQTDGKAVAWDDLVKGYEVEKGRFIARTEDDDVKTAAIERSRSIDIQAFVPINDVDVRYWPHGKVSAQELKLADQLISSLAGEWNPDAYHDDCVPALTKVIKARAAGKKMPAVPEKATPPTNVVDLVERLKQSLAAAKRAPKTTRAAARRPGRRGRRPAA